MTGTFAACLTPPGQGAIATVALAGPQAWEIVRLFFRDRGGRNLPAMPGRRCFRLGRLGDDMADDVVLAVKQTEPEPILEVHCHGGRAAVEHVLELFSAHGAEVCSWQDFSRQTGLDVVAVQALSALSEAPTRRTAAILLDQYHGALGRALDAVLIDLERGAGYDAGQKLGELSRWIAIGQHLTSPWRLVVAGAPNVGKSSLVNAIAGYERSLVAAVPGTTRDAVSAVVAIDGWPVELIDTAGLRTEATGVEQAGIALARSVIESADLCLWVVDASGPPVWPPENLRHAPRLVVNKVDLPPAWDLSAAAGVRVSAKTAAGLDGLLRAVAAALVKEPPPTGAAVPFTPFLCHAVADAGRLLREDRLANALALIRQARLGLEM